MIACGTRRAELAGTVRLELGPSGRIPLRSSSQAMISTHKFKSASRFPFSPD